VAIVLVLVGHALLAHVARRGWGIRLVENAGAVGVSLFFAISGFIITRLLTRERRQTGRIHLWRFYARRALRLWPPLWVLVLVTGLLGLAGVLSVHIKDIAGALFFVTDYLPGPHASVLYHTWSLSIEEQFYLVWPALLFVLSVRGARRFIVLAILAAPLVRVASYLIVPSWPTEYQFHDRYDVLAAGCLLALCWDAPWLQSRLRRHNRKLLIGAVAAVVAVEAVNAYLTSQGFILILGYSVEAIAMATIVGAAVVAAQSRVGRALNARAVVHLGVISYSLYLWQQMFVLDPFGVFRIVPLGVLAALAAAELSWRLVERPFFGVRARLHPPPRSSATAPPDAAEYAGAR
jgi:peptidoglycan/LPS O-acetylase OafA/YrhL